MANYPETGNLDTLIVLLRHSGNRLDRQTVALILQFRESVEGTAVRMLAAKHTDDHILRLRLYIYDFRKAAQQTHTAGISELAQLLFEYHLYIALKSGNNVIPMVLNGFHDVSMFFWQMWIQHMGVDEAIDFLEHFTQCIAAGNGDAAIALYHEASKRFMDRMFGDGQ